MAARTTRRKIKDVAGRINADLINVLEHMKYLSELADEQSEYINENLPGLVLMIQGTAEVMERFTNGL